MIFFCYFKNDRFDHRFEWVHGFICEPANFHRSNPGGQSNGIIAKTGLDKWPTFC